jgi:hypothetical protein
MSYYLLHNCGFIGFLLKSQEVRLDGGMEGIVNYYFFGAVVLPMVFFENCLRWLFVGGMVVDCCGLNLLGYHFPALVTPFPYRVERLVDIISGIVAFFVAIVMVNRVVVANYDREQKRLTQSARKLAAVMSWIRESKQRFPPKSTGSAL